VLPLSATISSGTSRAMALNSPALGAAPPTSSWSVPSSGTSSDPLPKRLTSSLMCCSANQPLALAISQPESLADGVSPPNFTVSRAPPEAAGLAAPDAAGLAGAEGAAAELAGAAGAAPPQAARMASARVVQARSRVVM
jgi:hypothetical protein